MRTSDKMVFADAATTFDVWLLVRRTNPKSLAYIGKIGYTPKRIECKAKTADRDAKGYKTAGLVVDASVHPHVFGSGKEAKAKSIWDSFARKHGLNEGDASTGLYTVERDTNSPHYGCVKYDGNTSTGTTTSTTSFSPSNRSGTWPRSRFSTGSLTCADPSFLRS